MLEASISKEKVKSLTVPRVLFCHLQFVTFTSVL